MEIHSDTIASAWENSIKVLLDDTLKLHFTQRGERAKEILGVQMVISRPLDEPIIPQTYPFGDYFIEDYCDNILDSSSGGSHSIGTRIVKRSSLDQNSNDQLKKVINLLKKSPDTRRAIICLWHLEKDLSTEHPPCACTIQFLIRNGKLDTIAYFRSNDSWMAALPDMIAITKLAKIISQKIGVPVGQYIHFAASYHLYEPDIIPAKLAFGRL